MVISVRYGSEQLDNEIESETGEIGQKMLADGTFGNVKPIPVEPQPTLEEKLTQMEQRIEEQSIIQLEVLATIYEELLMKG